MCVWCVCVCVCELIKGSSRPLAAGYYVNTINGQRISLILSKHTFPLLLIILFLLLLLLLPFFVCSQSKMYYGLSNTQTHTEGLPPESQILAAANAPFTSHYYASLCIMAPSLAHTLPSKDGEFTF